MSVPRDTPSPPVRRHTPVKPLPSSNYCRGRQSKHRFLSLLVWFCLHWRWSPLSVCVCILSIVSHVSFSHFETKTKDFFTFSVFAKNPSSLPHYLQCLPCILTREAPTLSMCRHTNEGIPSTEHVQMLHWACADKIMRGNPVTDMTDNTQYANTTDSVYTLFTLW